MVPGILLSPPCRKTKAHRGQGIINLSKVTQLEYSSWVAFRRGVKDGSVLGAEGRHGVPHAEGTG